VTPSVVSFDGETEPLVGTAAIAHMLSRPEQVAYSVKRFIGRTFREQGVRDDQQQVTYALEETQGHQVAVRLGERLVAAVEISAEVLRKLKSDAEDALGRKVYKAVVSVPAYFNEGQRKATVEAGQAAGLEVARLVNESTAAALAFGLGDEAQQVAVYDLGGGTFDISILKVEHGLFRVKAIGGDASARS
jgi:molecular chaperone DnaK